MFGGYLLYTDFFPVIVCEAQVEGNCTTCDIGQRFLNQFSNLI